MKLLLILLTILLFTGCGSPDAGDTEINIADGGSTAGDPVTDTNSGCAGSEDQCGQQVDN